MPLAKNQRTFIDLNAPNVEPLKDKKGKVIKGKFAVTVPIETGKEYQRVFKENLIVEKYISKNLVINLSLSQGRFAVDNDLTLYSLFFGDFRGRLYSSAFTLGLQGRDTIRSMIRAANAKELGERGLYWLASGVATFWGNGIEKDTFDARVAWTEQMYNSGKLAKIVAYALRKGVDLDPECEDYKNFAYEWRHADDPGRFVGAANDYIKAMKSGNPAGYKSARFIEFDATASGLQIMAAWTADKSATLVNVIPSLDGKRQDAYKIVADAVVARFKSLLDAPHLTTSDPEKIENIQNAAKFWLDFGITRSLMKRPVMTFGYSAVAMTFYDQIINEVFGDPRANVPNITKYCFFLANELYNTVLPDLLPGTMEFMNRLRMIAEALAETGNGIALTSRFGLPFRQKEFEEESEQINVELEMGRIQLVCYQKSDNIDVNGQKKGICPNLVHHGDGLLVQKTSRDLLQAGVESFITVHDCFGVLAADSDILYRTVRDNFVLLFNPDTLKEIWGQLTEPLCRNSREYINKQRNEIRALNIEKDVLKAQRPDLKHFSEEQKLARKERLDEIRREIAKLELCVQRMNEACAIEPPVGSFNISLAKESMFLFS